VYDDDSTNIKLSFENEVWTFSFSKEYDVNKKLTINKNLSFDESHIGQLTVLFDCVANYEDAEGQERCSISFESNTIEDLYDNSSSESSYSSTSSVSGDSSSESSESSESSTS